MANGILLALIAYASFSWGDAGIKLLGGQMTVFEIGLYTTLAAGLFIMPTKPRHERWLQFWKMKRPWLVNARAVTGNVAGLLGIIAFTTIPLAEAYALIFLSPFFITVLSIIFLKEEVGIWRWGAIAAGFIGVMLVVRPGFRELEIGHLAAAGIALMAATTVILLRTISQTEQRTSILGTMLVYGVVINLIGAAFTGLSLPSAQQALVFLGVGAFSGLGQMLLIAAARRAPANYIAPTQYTQIAWATVIGAVVFHEYPDGMAILGLTIITCAGLFTLLREKIRFGRVRWRPFRTRL